MINKKKVLISVLLISLLAFPLISAELIVEKQVITDTVIPEIGEPAEYNLKITNLGETDAFRIYSLVGIEIIPNQTFVVEGGGKSREINIKLYPSKTLLNNPGPQNFVYKISGENTGIQEDVMLIKIIKLDEAIEINSYNINLDSEKTTVYVKNRAGIIFPKIKAEIYSKFFNFSKEFPLGKYEKKEFEIPLNKDKIKNLTAGVYSTYSDIKIRNVEKKLESKFQFTEKAQITTKETKSGLLIRKQIIEKINEGNVATLVQAKMQKNALSRLFTTFNIEPSFVERKGFAVTYIFQKEVVPAENFQVKATTNLLYPLILIIALAIIGFLVKAYTLTHLNLKKKATFVKTKGGEFALKITLIVKARKFVEKIRIFEKIPSLVKLHKRFGAVEPDKIDEQHRRLEWNVDSLQPGEERIFSYIIYSKVSPVGRFELPRATAVYEKDGKIHETEGNRVFFLTEPKKID